MFTHRENYSVCQYFLRIDVRLLAISFIGDRLRNQLGVITHVIYPNNSECLKPVAFGRFQHNVFWIRTFC